MKTRSFAAGDDGAFIVEAKEVETLKQRIAKITVSSNTPQENAGCGLMIDSELTFDTELLCFLSKIIDPKSQSVVRKLDRVHNTGSFSSSHVPMPQINHSVNLQLREYAELPLFGEGCAVRKKLETDNKEISDTKYINEMSYKEAFSKHLNIPVQYCTRMLKNTGGLT